MQSYAKAEHNDQLKSSSSSNQGLRAHGFLEKNEQRCTVCHMENFSNVRTKQQATQPPVSNGAPMIVHDSAHGADSDSDSGEVDEAKVLRCRSNCSSPSGGDPPARRLGTREKRSLGPFDAWNRRPRPRRLHRRSRRR